MNKGSGGCAVGGRARCRVRLMGAEDKRELSNAKAPKIKKQEGRPERGWVDPKAVEGLTMAPEVVPSHPLLARMLLEMQDWHGVGDGRQEGRALSHLRGGLSQWKKPEGDGQG